MIKRHVFMISDGTGITAETLGNSLITQFENIEFEKITIPYIDSIDKAEKVLDQIDSCYEKTHTRPIVFMTLVNTDVAKIIRASKGCILDLFNTYLGPLEKELNVKSSYTVGRTHGVVSSQSYRHRIEAVEYAMEHDDGIKIRGYEKADVVLIGVSRCGKTPSCLYMALHFGVLAANYPFTEDDFSLFTLPEVLRPYKDKLFGLSIDPDRLHVIRTERRPDSLYASLDQCRHEVTALETMYRRENIPFLNSTRYSIEEISTKIMTRTRIKRRI